jgi:hypothetical protein
MSLHSKFIQLAKEKNKITYRLLSLLPEIYKSGEYKKYAYTIEGYAYMYAQIPESTVRKTLNLHQKIKDKPKLLNSVKDIGVHKISLVASIVNDSNEEIIVEKLKTMSKSALQEMSKELRGNNQPKKIILEISAELLSSLKKLQEQLKLNSEIETLAKVIEIAQQNLSPVINSNTISSRYIPVKTKKQLIRKYNHNCAYPGCQRESEQIHHQERFSKCKNHIRIVPLCKIHHEFAHNSLIKNETLDPSTWEFQLIKTTNLIDLKYQKFRS